MLRAEGLTRITAVACTLALGLAGCGSGSKDTEPKSKTLSELEAPAEPIALPQLPQPPTPPEPKKEKPAEPAQSAIDPQRIEAMELSLGTQKEEIERLRGQLVDLQSALATLSAEVEQLKSAKVSTSTRTSAEASTNQARAKPVRATRRSIRQQVLESPPNVPFTVESIDQWGSERRVVIRTPSGLVDLKPGDRHAGWSVESAEGESVTMRSQDGRITTIKPEWTRFSP